MSYISEIFERLDIQCIREYLLHGCDATKIDSRSYLERLTTPEKALSSMLESKLADKNECEEVKDIIYDYANALEEVHMEIGLQCGFILAMQISQNTNPNNQ